VKRTLLIVSYLYAPSPDVGAKRFSFLAREFEKLGYDVHVIANAPGDSPHGHRADPSLPLSGRVHTCKSPFELPLPGQSTFVRKLNALIARLLAPVGSEYFWARAATRRALEIARELPPGVVIATSPPHAALFAGARVARELGWPLILDYRDPWSGYEWPAWRRGRVVQWFAHAFESRLVERSAARVLNTPAMRTWFEKFFPLAPAARNFVIPNGFDALPAPAPVASGPINIVHAGTIFTGRSLVPVLEAMRRLGVKYPDRPIHLTTYGDLPEGEVQRIGDANLRSFVDVRPRLPLAQLQRELQAAHVLLAVVGEHMTYSTPYKVYDYMAAGRPVLGLAPRGAALFDLLEESGAGTCVEFGDGPGIEAAIEALAFGGARTERSRVDRFRWSRLALQYRLAIETVAASGTHRVPSSGAARRTLDLRR
jgi:glycosyltransferase involved in cell wall biosynthesis